MGEIGLFREVFAVGTLPICKVCLELFLHRLERIHKPFLELVNILGAEYLFQKVHDLFVHGEAYSAQLVEGN